MSKALIVGVSGERLTADEARFFARERPAGLILFARNCASHDQIRALVAAAAEAAGLGGMLVLIDQEGGRVQRLRPPLGRVLPPARAYADLYAIDPAAACRSARSAARLVGHDLRRIGINTDCAPVLDVPVAGAHDVIGDRAYGTEPRQVAALGRAVAEGLMAGGVLPVIKHIPGHGRAGADSHHHLPVVTASRAELVATDFAPFKALRDIPAAMTAHVVYTAIDPERPASVSPRVMKEVVRGEIGYDGLVMSDDLSMQALSGSIGERAAGVIAAGCDVALHCNGDLAEMDAAAAAVPWLSGAAERRHAAASAVLRHAESFDLAAAEASLAAVLSGHAGRAESV